MYRLKIILLFTTLICFGCTTPLPADYVLQPVEDEVEGRNPMVHQEGLQIVDPQGKTLILRGVLLEGWLQWQGHMWGAGLTSETELSTRLEQLAGAEEFQAFQHAIYENFITEQDIEMIAQLGLNVVRVPINHHVLEDASGQVSYDAVGWEYLDRLMVWGARHGVYIVLDLHAAPGGQSGFFVADPDPQKLWENEENENQTVALWQALASRYKNETIVAGYDLLNEPGFPNPADLLDLYVRIIKAIREIDPYHMIILEGNLNATDFSFFSRPISSNQVYSFHTYNFLSNEIDEDQMQTLKNMAEEQKVPLWNGEFGAHNKAWITETIAMFENPDNLVRGWIFWPWKRVSESSSERWRHLMAIQTTPAWEAVGTAVALPLDSENMLARETALQGMAEFIDSIKAENLTLDQEIADVLTEFDQ